MGTEVTTKVAIADDHVLFADGVSRALAAVPDIDVLGTASNGRELVDLLDSITPDVLLIDLEMPELDGLAAYRSAISEYAAANPDVEWITGGGWSMPVFGPGGSPSKTIIDELVPDRPVYLTSADGHSGWANSRALEIAGITKDTPDPPDGVIDRDPETGEPIGSLQEGAMNLVRRHVPADTLASRQQGLRYAMDLLHGYGITSIQDAIVSREELETYRSLERTGDLDLRVVASLWWDRERGLEQVPDLVALRDEFLASDRIDPTTVKIMQDGVMENYTAAMLEPYLVPSGTKGIPMVDPRLRQR